MITLQITEEEYRDYVEPYLDCSCDTSFAIHLAQFIKDKLEKK